MTTQQRNVRVRASAGVPLLCGLVAGIALVAGCSGGSTAPDDVPAPRTVTTTITLPHEEVDDPAEPAASAQPTPTQASRYPPADGSVESLRHPDWVYGEVTSVQGNTLVVTEFYEYGDYGPEDPRTEISRAYAVRQEYPEFPPPNMVATVEVGTRRTFSLDNPACEVRPLVWLNSSRDPRPCSESADILADEDDPDWAPDTLLHRVRISRDGDDSPTRIEALFYS